MFRLGFLKYARHSLNVKRPAAPAPAPAHPGYRLLDSPKMEEHKLRRRSTKNLSFSLEKKHSARKKAFKNAAKFRANLSGNAKKQAERKRQLAKELRRREKAAAIAEKKARRAGVHKGAERQRKAELARQRRKKKEGSF